MLPVLEGPGVESISANASARDPVMILLVRPGLYTLFVIYHNNTAYKKRRHLTHFQALEHQKPRSSRVQNKRIWPLVSSHTPRSRSRVERPQRLGLEA